MASPYLSRLTFLGLITNRLGPAGVALFKDSPHLMFRLLYHTLLREPMRQPVVF